MTKNKEKEIIAVKRGAYKLPLGDEEGHLIGTKCTTCGSYNYPARNNCLDCFSDEVEETALSKRGIIWAYTIPHKTYDGVLLKPPFIAAKIKLPEEVFVLSLVTGVDIEDVKIGTEVECYFYTIWEDEKKQVIAFAFKPVSK